MNHDVLPKLFAGLLDDAAMFPPEDAPLGEALQGHAVHRSAWYRDMVGSFVCTAARIPALAEAVARRRLGLLRVTLIVPQGLDFVGDMLASAREMDVLDVVVVEVPLGAHRIETAIDRLRDLAGPSTTASLEIPVRTVTEKQVHKLAQTGIRLKLRTGGTTIDAFHTEEELARPLVLCAAERQAFKCTAGLHHAVRHTARSLFEHHGFLNLALAARVAASSGSVAATRELLAQREPRRIAYLVGELTVSDVHAIRALFTSFGTCSVLDPVTDLVDLGLLVAR
ncbi:MAG: hypothetical protein ABJB98_08740 [Actinomycetota bacterium]